MLELVDTGINSFASVASQADVSPIEEPIFIITSGQLQDLIQEAIEQAMAPLEARIEVLEQKVRGRGNGPEIGWEQASQDATGSHTSSAQVVQNLREELGAFQEITARERAYDRQRLARLERVDPQPLQKDRGEILRALIAANGGKMLATDARKMMHLSRPLFSMLLVAMKDDIQAKPYHLNKSWKVLVLR